MKVKFMVVSKECSIQKGTLARLVSTVDCNGKIIEDEPHPWSPPLVTIEIDAKDANLLDNFKVGDTVELQLAICSIDKRRVNDTWN